MENFATLNKNLIEVVKKEDFTIKVLKNNSAKINPKTADAYRHISDKMNALKMSWYSFENKQTRPFRVMVKGLHHTWEEASIVQDLKNQGLQVLEAVNKIGWKSKNPLDMFIVSFQCDEDASKIQNIKYILNTRVTVETLRMTKLIPQCKRCQGYGHTQKYCQREPRCVKCLEKHLTLECLKTKDNSKPKCCHCGEEHPANYRGCLIAKDLQKMKAKSLLKTNSMEYPRRSAMVAAKAENKVNKIGSKTYAQVATNITKKAHSTVRGKDEPSNISKTLEIILEKLNSFDERLKKIEYSAKGAIPKSRTQNE